jgi:hypothetical protein
MRLIRSLTLLSAILVSLTVRANAADFRDVGAGGLTKDQAKQLLMLVLRHERYKLRKPGVFVDGDLKDDKGKPPHTGYFDFSVGYDSPKAGATEYWGLFAVSVRTGDVWELNSCKHYIRSWRTRVRR